MLCQIARCWRYAEIFGRYLIIDTTVSGMVDNLFDYFEMRSEPPIPVSGLSPELLVILNTIDSVFPSVLRGRISSYNAVYQQSGRAMVDQDSEVPLSFNFSKDYDEQLIVHHQYGGGTADVTALQHLRLRLDIAVKIVSRYPELTDDHSAIHIRNTDLKTDYQALIRTIERRVRNDRIVVCSDDPACIDYVGTRLSATSQIFSGSSIPDAGGKPLHYNSEIDRTKANIDMLCDLFWLSMSRNLYVMKSRQGLYSGFSRLAARLMSERQLLGALVANALKIADQHRDDPYARPPATQLRRTMFTNPARPRPSVWQVKKIPLSSLSVHFVTRYRDHSRGVAARVDHDG